VEQSGAWWESPQTKANDAERKKERKAHSNDDDDDASYRDKFVVLFNHDK
jgi:hypothetical protein